MRVVTGMLWAAAGYLAGAFGGGWLVSTLSSNAHDPGVEAAMTGAFVIGPLAAIAAFVAGFAQARGRSGVDREVDRTEH